MLEQPNGRPWSPQVRLLIGVVISLGAAALILYHIRWIKSVLEGPAPFTLAALQEVKDPQALSNPWISLDFSEAVDSGFVMQTTKQGDTKERSKYLLIKVGNGWLITDVPVNFTGNHVVGYLDNWWSPLSKQVIEHVKGRFPEREILPYQLNAEYSYKGQCLSMLGVAGFVFLAGLAVIWFAGYEMRKTKIKDIAEEDSGDAAR